MCSPQAPVYWVFCTESWRVQLGPPERLRMTTAPKLMQPMFASL